MVAINPYMGTANRNHCNWCLWSKHVDIKVGDRASHCQSGMRPVGLTFKERGEAMLVHECGRCGKTSYCRLAADDSTSGVLALATAAQRHEVETQLFGLRA
jgi:hypothetical protein